MSRAITSSPYNAAAFAGASAAIPVSSAPILPTVRAASAVEFATCTSAFGKFVRSQPLHCAVATGME